MSTSLAQFPKMPLPADHHDHHHEHSNSDTDTDSDSEHPQSRHHADLSSSIFKSYLESTGKSSASAADLSKIQSFLSSSAAGALSCLICLERIRPSDPTWSCTALCFAPFHLVCIQSWARQSSSLRSLRSTAPNPSDHRFPWHCPKCRSEYPFSDIPKTYLCFCGKSENPPSDPWILPHSCGAVCSRPLRGSCGHRCLLLCHPGPCPPCPKTLRTQCFCGKKTDTRRCASKPFSCSAPCRKALSPCRTHLCPEPCHAGECAPCRRRGPHRCLCGRREEAEAECREGVGMRCGGECGGRLGCGRHACERGCHAGECGPCPFDTGGRRCPCGRKAYQAMGCDSDPPLCGGTCSKLLPCGFHTCPDRCHRGPCALNCRLLVAKLCRCRSVRKEVPCHQDISCERKCQNQRDCGRHACRRRCCDGDCPPCSEVCDRRLRCKNHKCPSPCHRGPCAPCPIMVTISCQCGETHFEVPCGTETDQKPPRCSKRCTIKPLCKHAPNLKPHKCHYGACPQCKLPCGDEYPCGHACKLRCHDSRPPPNLDFTLKPKKKKSHHQIEGTSGTPCPPCAELVWRPCVGQHIGAEKMMVCSNRSQFSCENLCGNILECTNHYCTKTCHSLSSSSQGSEPCEACNLQCEKERDPVCSHPCTLRCHPGDCPECKALVKRSCHCGSMVHAFECINYNGLSEKAKMAARSCGGPCHRKLPNCSHLCPETCHPGQCPAPEKCSKKVTIRCGCQTLKKEWLCHAVQSSYRIAGTDPKDVSRNQFGIGLIPCDSNCKSKLKDESDLHLRKSKAVEVKEPEVEKHGPKRKKRRERVNETKQISTLQKVLSTAKWFLFCTILAVAVIAALYYGYKGLLWVNDWMNEVDDQRKKRSYRRV